MTVFGCGFHLTQADAEKEFENAVATSHQAVFVMLRQALPDWEKINKSAAFLAWLDQADVFAGTTRRQLLKEPLTKTTQHESSHC